MRHSGPVRLIVLAAVTASAAIPARAREARDGFAPVMVGSRVRLLAPTALTGRIEGTVMQSDEQFLLLASRDNQPFRVPRAAITQLELSTGRTRNPIRGALIGAAIFGALSAPFPRELWCDDLRPGESCDSRAEIIGYGIVGGAMWGALFGALIKRDRWSAVPLEQVKLSVAPVRGRGVRLSLALRW